MREVALRVGSRDPSLSVASPSFLDRVASERWLLRFCRAASRLTLGEDCAGLGVFGLAADAALGYLRQRGNFRFRASAERVFVSENDDLLNAFLSKTAYVQLDKDVNARRVRPRVDVYCFVFPCQPSSTMGKLLRHRDSRSQPQKGVEAYVSGVKPTSFVLENVCNIARGGGAAKSHSFVRRLEKCGYCVYQKDIDSKHYGVLQSRPRRYVVGIRQEICHKTPFAWPEPRIATCELASLLDADVGRP